MASACVQLPRCFDRSWWETLDYPAIVWDQNFGTVLSEADLYPAVTRKGFIVRPRSHAAMRCSGKSEVFIDTSKFLVKLSVGDFRWEELEVKICGNHVVVKGKHQVRTDEHGAVERKFSRRYVLPTDSDPKEVKCTLTPNGNLFIKAPKIPAPAQASEERLVPITFEEVAEEKEE